MGMGSRRFSVDLGIEDLQSGSVSPVQKFVRSYEGAAAGLAHGELPEKLRKENEKVLRNRKLDEWAWKSDSFFNFLHCNGLHGPCPGIIVPPTVFISNGRVMDAFYTNSRGQFTSLDSPATMDEEAVMSFLSPHLKRGNPMCCWRPLYSNDEFEATPFMRETEARAFLMSGKKMPDGVFQAFIPPVSNRNSYLIAKWHKNTVHVEKCENLYRLTDANTKGDDAVTVCGGTARCWQSKAMGMNQSSFLMKRILATCDKVVNHIMTVSPQACTITHIELVFKQDLSGVLYLCWANRLSITHFSAEHKAKLMGELMADVNRNRKNHTNSLNRLKSMLREEPDAFNRKSRKYYKALLPGIKVPPGALTEPKPFIRPGARRRKAEWILPPLLRRTGADTR